VLAKRFCISYNDYALQKSLKKRKRSSYFFDESVKIDFGYKAEPISLPRLDVK